MVSRHKQGGSVFTCDEKMRLTWIILPLVSPYTNSLVRVNASESENGNMIECKNESDSDKK